MKYKGFTLVECLLALLVFSLCLLLVPRMIIQSKHMNEVVLGRHEQEWHVFLLQFEQKLSEGEFVKAQGSKVFFNKPRAVENKVYECRIEYNAKNQEIVIRDDGGYEPILTSVENVTFIQYPYSVTFEITFNNGEKRDGKWTF
ncbi:MAG TPA: competence type IV pilus minor pilin ComGF [Enterococcus sp.]|nr:competence type IV pilus minor pilin ComGF [Enterococcus sp.]